jgi:multidrug efflux system outer membrane protein
MVALLPGCKVGPDYVRPEVETPATFRFEVRDAPDLVNTAWWEQFDDPVLTQLITTALAQNKDVRIAAARVEEAAGVLGVTRSQLFPQVGAGAGVVRQQVSRFSGTNTLQEGFNRTFTNYQVLLSASWEIDFFGKLQRQTEAARATLLATDDGRRATLLSLVAAVANEYITLRDLDKQLEISRRTADSRGESVRLFELRFKGGVVAELELEQVRSEYEQALAAIPDLERQIAQQENLISVLLGSNPGPIPRGSTLDELALPAVPAGLPSELLERRPDLLQAEQNLVATNAQIGAAKALYYPTISLTGQAGTLSTQWSKLFTGDARTWSFGPTVSLPIFTAGAIRGQVAQGVQHCINFCKRRAIRLPRHCAPVNFNHAFFGDHVHLQAAMNRADAKCRRADTRERAGCQARLELFKGVSDGVLQVGVLTNQFFYGLGIFMFYFVIKCGGTLWIYIP